jgi:hypothetical protein
MRLYLVQHGEAKSEAEDPERSLTFGGEEETRLRVSSPLPPRVQLSRCRSGLLEQRIETISQVISILIG